MSNITICDLCEKPLMEDFSDEGFKVTVKRLTHAYDGYAPWVRKQKLHICGLCIQKILARVAPKPKSEGEK